MKLALVVIAALFCVVPAAAATGPSLAATDLWLDAHLPAAAVNSSGLNGSWFVTASYDAEGCRLKIHTVTKVQLLPAPDRMVYHLEFAPATGSTFDESSTPSGNGVTDSMATIEFSDISPSGVKVSAFSASSDDYTLPPINVAPKLLAFAFDDENMAQRVKRAMLHAINLCGGKPDVF